MMSRKKMSVKPFYALSLSVICLIVSVLSGCAVQTVEAPLMQINRLIFQNDSAAELKDVRIYVTKTSEFIRCAHVLPKAECSTGFKLRDYKGNRFDVSWQQDGQPRLIKDILAKQPDVLRQGVPLQAVITFGAAGEFKAELQYE